MIIQVNLLFREIVSIWRFHQMMMLKSMYGVYKIGHSLRASVVN